MSNPEGIKYFFFISIIHMFTAQTKCNLNDCNAFLITAQTYKVFIKVASIILDIVIMFTQLLLNDVK